MAKRVVLSLAGLLLSCQAAPAFGQISPEELFRKAQAAFEAGAYIEARDLASKASKTAPESSDVFLLLGKAHYQLGALDEAIEAWQQTVELEPEEEEPAMLETSHVPARAMGRDRTRPL